MRLSRPLFLYGGIAGVALGAAVARSAGLRLDLATYAWAQALVTSFQLMVHYANDYFDRKGDAHGTTTAWSGGSGVLGSGAVQPGVALGAALVCAVLGLGATAHFLLTGNGAAAWLGAAVFVLAWSYSAPPARLAARGLGEIDSVLVVAILVPFIGYSAFAGRLSDAMTDVVTATAFAMFAMMLCVELPDAGADRAAGKRNLVVRWGPGRAWQLITIAALIAVGRATTLAYRVDGGPALFALVPSAIAAVRLVLVVLRDPRPGTIALWGVMLYATVAGGLAVFYALIGVR